MLAAAANVHGEAMAMRLEILDPGRELDGGVGIILHGVEQGRLQIAAMNRPIRRAVLRLHVLSERDAYDLASAARASDRDRLRRHDLLFQGIAEPERPKH